MRQYTGIASFSVPDPDAPDFTPRLRNALGTIDVFLRDVNAGLGRVDRGERPSGGGVTLGGVSDHGDLSGLGDDDHAQYLLLAGRSGQTVTGPYKLTITGSGASTDPALVVRRPPSSTGARVMTIESVGGTESVRFNAVDTTGAKLEIYNPGSGDTALQICTAAGFAATAPWLRVRSLTGTNKFTFEIADEVDFARPAAILGGSTHLPVNVTGALLQVNGTSSDTVGLRLRQSSGSPTANMAEFQDSSSVVRAAVTKDGYLSTRQALLNGSTSGTCTIVPAATTTNHTLTLPSANAAGALVNDGSGGLTWGTSPGVYAYVAVTSDPGLTAAHTVVDCTSGTFTLALPAAATAGAGKLYIVKNSGAGVITLDGDSGETIDGAATLPLAALASASVVSTGAAWIVV